MSKRLGHVLPVHRLRASQCRRAPSLICQKVQARAFSDVQQHSSNWPASGSDRFVQPRGAASPGTASASIEELEEHLNELFPPLKFPPDLAARILTHSSHPEAVQRHNARLSFIGRRVLQSYLLLFLHGSPALQPVHEYELIAARAINTYMLGEFVAPHWELGRVLRWTPVHTGPLSMAAVQRENVRDVLGRLGSEASRSVGMYKVHGTAVEAVVGGVFHQFGGSVAHRLFHTRMLPHLLLPGRSEGLHDVFHEHALQVCQQMGGPNGALVVPS
ncbi:ribonuclease-III-like-domain-containing protein [Sparassis latifolia]